MRCVPVMVLFTGLCAPDKLLFTELCTRHVIIHCPVHRTVTIHYPVHQPQQRTKYFFPPFFLHLTSTFGRIFLRLKQTYLEYNPINLDLEPYVFLVLLLASLFLLKQSSEWYFLYRKS
jgi:hypothetical protein